MDKEFIKMTISAKQGKDDRLIKQGDIIDDELIEILCSESLSNMKKAFYIYDGNFIAGQSVYFVQLKCPICGRLHMKELSKTKTLKVLKDIKDKNYDDTVFLCEACKVEYDLNKKRKEIEETVNWEERKKQAVKDYIESYLNPNNSFKDEISAKEKIHYIFDYNFCGFPDEKEIEKSILNMSYKDFLNTPYWDGVRNYKLKRANYCCELCGRKGILNVHHKTYANHGSEHIRSIANSDLIVLCKNCHEKFHDKLGNKEA